MQKHDILIIYTDILNKRTIMTNIQLILLLLWTIVFMLLILLIKTFFSNKQASKKELLEQLSLQTENSQLKFIKELLREFGSFQGNINEKIDSKFSKILKENRQNEQTLLKNLEIFMDTISDKVDKKLESWFEKTNKTFNSIIERLSKIDEAQKNIDKLNTEVISLQNVLTDNKTRWIFWEVQLQSILEWVFGEKNKKMFEMQYHFKYNNTSVDAVVKTTRGLICIDAKFPLVHYRNMSDKSNSKEKRKEAEKFFIAAVKKQVIEISSKYIIKDSTLEQAFLFLPAEAIFAEINAYYPQIIDFAQKNNISIVSPTTLMAMLTIVANAMRSLETQKQAQVIQTELAKLSDDFGRFETRWNKFTKDFNSVGKDIADIDITNQKIISRFWGIERLELEEK